MKNNKISKKGKILRTLTGVEANCVEQHNEEFGETWRGRSSGITVPMDFEACKLFAQVGGERFEVISSNGQTAEIRPMKTAATKTVPLSVFSTKTLREIAWRIRQQTE